MQRRIDRNDSTHPVARKARAAARVRVLFSDPAGDEAREGPFQRLVEDLNRTIHQRGEG